MGANDPQYNCLEKIDFFLGHELASYNKEYPPSTQARSLPINILHDIDAYLQSGTPKQQAICDLTWI